MDSERKEELQALTEAQALGKLVAFGLRVEVEAFRCFVSATARGAWLGRQIMRQALTTQRRPRSAGR